jgi:hypothetical protein
MYLPLALQLRFIQEPYLGLLITPQSVLPMYTLVFFNLLPQQSPLFKIYTLTTVGDPLNLAIHQAPFLSFFVHAQVKAPLPHLAS